MTEVNSKTQYWSAICVNLLSVAIGASISWTSPYLPLLKHSQNSPLGLPLSDSEASLIGSLLAVGALVGSFLFGWLSEKLGRFWSLQICALPQIIWWTILIFSPNVTALLIGRFLAGISTGGVFILVPLYITEISQDCLRGTLGSFFILSTNAGMLLVYAAGIIFDYSMTPRVLILLPITFVITFSFFPETPLYLLQTNKVEQAEKSLRFYRSRNKDSQLSDNEKLEMEKLMKKIEGNENKKRTSVWNELKKPAAKKGILIGIMLVTSNQLSGFFVFLNYTATLFIESGSDYSPDISALIMGVILVLGSFGSLTLVNRFSRKVLYTLTTVGYALGLVMSGLYNMCKDMPGIENFKLVPMISLAIVIFIGAMGRLPLTYVIMSEIMPHNIRSFGISIANTVNWLLAFILLQYLSTAFEVLLFHNCMFIFSAIVMFGLFFVIYYVPETKNKSLEEIEIILNKGCLKIENNEDNFELQKLNEKDINSDDLNIKQ